MQLRESAPAGARLRSDITNRVTRDRAGQQHAVRRAKHREPSGAHDSHRDSEEYVDVRALAHLRGEAGSVHGERALDGGGNCIGRCGADELREVVASRPRNPAAHATIGDARLAMKDTAAALSEYEQEPLPMFRLTGQAIVRNRIGDRKGAVEALHGLLTQLGDSAAYQQAQVRAQWGDADAAFASLNRAFEVGDSGLTYLQVDPLMDPIRTDRRFPDQLRRLNLT